MPRGRPSAPSGRPVTRSTTRPTSTSASGSRRTRRGTWIRWESSRVVTPSHRRRRPRLPTRFRSFPLRDPRTRPRPRCRSLRLRYPRRRPKRPLHRLRRRLLTCPLPCPKRPARLVTHPPTATSDIARRRTVPASSPVRAGSSRMAAASAVPARRGGVDEISLADASALAIDDARAGGVVRASAPALRRSAEQGPGPEGSVGGRARVGQPPRPGPGRRCRCDRALPRRGASCSSSPARSRSHGRRPGPCARERRPSTRRRRRRSGAGSAGSSGS